MWTVRGTLATWNRALEGQEPWRTHIPSSGGTFSRLPHVPRCGIGAWSRPEEEGQEPWLRLRVERAIMLGRGLTSARVGAGTCVNVRLCPAFSNCHVIGCATIPVLDCCFARNWVPSLFVRAASRVLFLCSLFQLFSGVDLGESYLKGLFFLSCVHSTNTSCHLLQATHWAAMY